MKKLWLVMFVVVCFCCALAAGTSQAGVVKAALSVEEKVSGLQTPDYTSVKFLAVPGELSFTPSSFDGPSAAVSKRRRLGDVVDFVELLTFTTPQNLPISY
jgi:hypothetical protein